MKNEKGLSRIISAIFGNKIAVRENLFYDSTKGSLDFLPDDLPNWRAVQSLLNGIGLIVRQPFTTSTTSTGQFVIQWQTDIPTGQTSTYAVLFGNIVEIQWFVIPGGTVGGFANGSANVSWTTDSSGNVLVVTIDMGSPQNGYLRLG